MSPPQTIRTLPTKAHACPIRGLGTWPVVWKRLAELSRVENRYTSLRAVSRTRPPNRYRSPLGVAVAGSAWPYRGNGDGDGDVGGATPGLFNTFGGRRTSRRAAQGNDGGPRCSLGAPDCGGCCCCCTLCACMEFDDCKLAPGLLFLSRGRCCDCCCAWG